MDTTINPAFTEYLTLKLRSLGINRTIGSLTLDELDNLSLDLSLFFKKPQSIIDIDEPPF